MQLGGEGGSILPRIDRTQALVGISPKVRGTIAVSIRSALNHDLARETEIAAMTMAARIGVHAELMVQRISEVFKAKLSTDELSAAVFIVTTISPMLKTDEARRVAEQLLPILRDIPDENGTMGDALTAALSSVTRQLAFNEAAAAHLVDSKKSLTSANLSSALSQAPAAAAGTSSTPAQSGGSSGTAKGK